MHRWNKTIGVRAGLHHRTISHRSSRERTALFGEDPSWNSCFSDDPMDVGNLMSGSSVFYKSSLNIWKFMVHILLKPSLASTVDTVEHYFATV